MAVAVKATGHGVIREANDSLLIVTSELTDVRVNADAQTAWVSAGTKWGRVLEETQAVGLAPVLGSSPDVGAVSYTLGGGMGWLARKYGISADSVNQFELVTADGNLVHASAAENADLFWALRGGGGNFGVVTAMEIRLYPVTKVYGGNSFYPIEKAKEVYARYRNWIVNAPDELTSSVLIMNFPPFPQIPERLRGQSFVMVRGCYCGPLEQGKELLKYWRDWQSPINTLQIPIQQTNSGPRSCVISGTRICFPFSQLRFARADDGLRAVCDLQFGENARDIILHSLDAQGESVRDRRLVIPLCDQIENLKFAFGQLGEFVGLIFLDEAADDDEKYWIILWAMSGLKIARTYTYMPVILISIESFCCTRCKNK